jgi:SMODS-associated and fused to various effectors sensor domain
MCSAPGCRRRLALEAEDGDRALVGQAAHMVARKPKGPRGDAAPEAGDLHGYGNLILLCAHHHREIDTMPRQHSVAELRGWKKQHEAWVESWAPGTKEPWTVIVQEGDAGIDAEEAVRALEPDGFAGRIERLHANVEKDGWERAARESRARINGLLSRTAGKDQRFAVFSMGRIPLAVQLGFVLTDRTRAKLFQYDRDRGTWGWPHPSKPETDLPGTPQEPAGVTPETPRMTVRRGGAGVEAAIRVSLSARVAREDTAEAALEIDIGLEQPSVRWLRGPGQLEELARVYEEALAAIRERGCRRVHLYYAGPAPGAVLFGRSYNARMNPELVVYEYCQGRRPAYEAGVRVNGG